MNRISIPYDGRIVEAEIDWGAEIATLDISDAPALQDISAALANGLHHPIGMTSRFLGEFNAADSVAILVSDAYRRTAIDKVLPHFLHHLAGVGICTEQVRFVFASGIHKPPTPAQQRSILGPDVYDRFAGRIFLHEPHDETSNVMLGTTSRGTPVEISRRVLECDRIVATGTVVLHYFGGFGGGRKSVVPGVASARTIAHNHAMNLDPAEDRLNPSVRIGVIDGNPVAEDMLEAARFVPVDGIINTVLNQQGDIAGLFAGDLDAAHRSACAFARDLYARQIDGQADLVIASAGAARNYVQSHKALYNAYQAMKPGGCIVFLAPCTEGLGGEVLEKWLRLGDTNAIIRQLRNQSEIYGQTALSTLEKAPSAILVTELPEEDVRKLGGRKAANLADALEQARERVGNRARILLMPSAAYTSPVES